MQNNIDIAKKIACPTCQTMTIWSEKNTYRPFCCERCKLIDLGEWASESYAIAQKHSEEDEIFSSMMQTDPSINSQ